MMGMLGWAANAVLIAGQWSIGSRRRAGFLLIALGEFLWVLKSIWLAQADMLFICVVFGALALRNWYTWGTDGS